MSYSLQRRSPDEQLSYLVTKAAWALNKLREMNRRYHALKLSIVSGPEGNSRGKKPATALHGEGQSLWEHVAYWRHRAQSAEGALMYAQGRRRKSHRERMKPR